MPSLVLDGARRVFQVADWVGGTGTKPATGDYIGATGLTAIMADAVDVRGAAGTGTGDMEKVDYDTNADGKVTAADIADSAPWAGITDKPVTFPPAAHSHADATTGASGFMSGADKAKLDGVASGATTNATDAALRDRSIHTRTQLATTISNVSTAADARISAAVGASVQAYNAALIGTTGTFTTAMSAKLGFITVTGNVDLDDLRAKVLGLDQAIILKGTWDASVGSFPGAGVAQAGFTYIVSTGGTVNGQTLPTAIVSSPTPPTPRPRPSQPTGSRKTTPTPCCRPPAALVLSF
ncbi:hypothetical protein NKI31_31340 [Mesorhizobium sp. M0659]|uniref:hypothetical protein n=1 Tax=Mesorhizobium sp. M0659 TaxID=2956980 RepID=UPI00333A233B